MNKLTKSLVIASAVVAGTFVTAKALNAQSIAPLVVAPARQSMAADPGKKVNFAVRFYNTGADPISGTFNVADFIVEDNKGTPKFLEGPTKLSDRFAAAQWVKLNTDKGTISGGGMVTINGSINIPSNARPGGRYFAIFFEPDVNIPSATGNGHEEAAITTMRLAGLVYLRVNGPISESAGVTKFSAPNFSEYGPIPVTTEIKNNGDYHITPTGKITVKDMLGRIVADEDLTEANIFPDASRITTTNVGTKWMIGKFTATLATTYGETAKPLTSTLSFWVFPWRLAVIIILGMIIFALIITIIFNRFVKKEKKLEAELIEEKEELEKLKERLQDKINEVVPPGPKSES